jgi:hypothetical protein
MQSIFNPQDNQKMIARIHQLNPNSQAVWGKMSVDQMFKHCTGAINVAFDKQEVKVNFLMRFLGKTLKNKIFNSEFKKNSPTAKEFIFTDQYDFETSKNDLVEAFSTFSKGTETIKISNHPFWGKMTSEDWNTLMWKHLDHHLKQFGV